MWQEKIIFEEVLQKATTVWKYTGIQINYSEHLSRNTLLGNLRKRCFYIINFLVMIYGVMSFFVNMLHMSTQIILYMIPCVTFCLLGGIKSFFFVYHENMVVEIIKILMNLQSNYGDYSGEKHVVRAMFVKKHLRFLNISNKMLHITGYVGVAAFFVGPLGILVWQYSTNREITLFLPYDNWYPFDKHSYGGWSLAFLHQFWSAWTAVYFVFGSDSFFYIACTFVQNQFCSLNFDMQKIGPDYFKNKDYFKTHIGSLLHRHTDLIRCVDMINIIYEISTLFNVISSSFIICLAGFNIMAIDDLIMMVPFVTFIFFGLVQIYLLCYYGDLLMNASIETSDSIYNSQWCKLDASSMKCCLFMLMRAQKPCKIVAFGYGDINLKKFSKILSSSWSYFTVTSCGFRINENADYPQHSQFIVR